MNNPLAFSLYIIVLLVPSVMVASLARREVVDPVHVLVDRP